jgi:hypothetical protein
MFSQASILTNNQEQSQELAETGGYTSKIAIKHAEQIMS